MPGAIDFPEGLWSTVFVIDSLPLAKGDRSIGSAVNDEERRFDVPDSFQVLELVSGDDGKVGQGAIDGEEGRNQDDAMDLVTLRQPTSWARAHGLSEQDEAGRVDLLFLHQELVSALCVAITGALPRRAGAVAVARVIVAEDAQTLHLEGLKEWLE